MSLLAPLFLDFGNGHGHGLGKVNGMKMYLCTVYTQYTFLEKQKKEQLKLLFNRVGQMYMYLDVSVQRGTLLTSM